MSMGSMHLYNGAVEQHHEFMVSGEFFRIYLPFSNHYTIASGITKNMDCFFAYESKVEVGRLLMWSTQALPIMGVLQPQLSLTSSLSIEQ